MPMTPKEMVKLLKANGFVELEPYKKRLKALILLGSCYKKLHESCIFR